MTARVGLRGCTRPRRGAAGYRDLELVDIRERNPEALCTFVPVTVGVSG